MWVKKIWEMSGPSNTNGLNLQVKQNIPVNIRPKNWRSNNVELFNSRLDFITALNEALQRFYPTRYPDWLSTVQRLYLERTGNYL